MGINIVLHDNVYCLHVGLFGEGPAERRLRLREIYVLQGNFLR